MIGKKLPCAECRGRCCTYPPFLAAEFNLVRLLHGIPRGTMVRPIQHDQSYDPATKPGTPAVVLHLADGSCPYLKDGKCSIYEVRPVVCKDYGISPELPCEYLYPAAAEAKTRARIARSSRGGA